METHSVRSATSKSGETFGWLLSLGRTGCVAKGLVYCLVGGLAIAAAAGAGGEVGGSKNAIAKLGQQPFGQVLLIATGIGLLCYAIWRIAQAFVDPNDEGTDKEGAIKRVAYVISGVIHLGLTAYAFSFVFGGSSSSSGGGSGGASDWTAKLMGQPFGQWLVGIAGIVIITVGVRQFMRAYQASFMDNYDQSKLSGKSRMWSKRLGQIGLSARGVVFALMGIFVIRAAIQADPSESRGLGGALSNLAGQPSGPWLLGIVAAGLVAYGVFCFSYARYRDFQRS
ncbi:MAG: DUF1206 domain-containing protein [Planctomycetota bacterium]